MIKKNLFILCFNLLFCFNVFADETITIDIWNDRNVTSWNTVNIIAEVWWDCSNFSISQVYFMEQNDKWDWWTIQSGWVSDTTYTFVATETKQIKALINCPQWAWPLFFSQISDDDIITVTVWEKKSSWKSWSTKMREEAESLFYNSWSIEKINLEIWYRKEDYSPLVYIYWNNLWADWQITYDLEYSTWSTFEEYHTFKTTGEFYNFFKNDFSYWNYIHYFRVRASYLWKYSNYSNILKYYSEDYLNIKCLNEKKYINFGDVFLSYDLLINSNLEIKCKKCIKNINNNDSSESINSTIEKYFDVNCKKCWK